MNFHDGGQWRQLLDLLKGLSVPQDLDAREIVSIFGDKLPYALAIVLVEEGKSLREKDIVALASQIEFEISPELTFQIVEDFFRMQPDTFTFERAVGDHVKNKRESGGDWIEDMCVILTRGDITKRDAILWGYTLAECEPYLKSLLRDITFREAVLAFLGVKDDGG